MSLSFRPINTALLSAVCSVALAAPTLHAAGKAKSAPPAQPTVAPKALAPAPQGKQKPAKVDPLVAEEEYSPVPASGPLNLAQLIELALYNNAKVLEARGKLDVARAERKAVTDWDDPEIRLSWARQTDIEVGSPFTERSRSVTNMSGTEYDNQSQYGTESELGLSKNVYRIDAERGRFRETRYRNVERLVIPGATRDKIITTEYETRRNNSKGTSRRVSGDDFSSKEENYKTSRNSGQKVLSKTTTYEYHRDTTEPESEVGILLRFPFPNPFEVKALVKQAEAEIRAADYELKAIENEIVMEVRSIYEELAYAEALKTAQANLAGHRQKYVEFSRLGAPDKIAGAAGNTSESRIASMEASMKASNLRLKLATLIGLSDVNRISVASKFRHRIVDLSRLDEGYLIQMASVFRSDLNLLHAKNESARAAYKAERAARVPVSTFLDVGYSHQDDYQGRDSGEFQVRLGVSLPLWSWLMNDADKVPQAEARAYSRQIGRLQTNIETEVRTALQVLRMFDAEMASAAKEQAALKVLIKNEAVSGALLSSNPQEVQSKSEEVLLRSHLDQLQLHRLYNQALLQLEMALGTRLEKVLPLKD